MIPPTNRRRADMAQLPEPEPSRDGIAIPLAVLAACVAVLAAVAWRAWW
jgi:hypothetical protein